LEKVYLILLLSLTCCILQFKNNAAAIHEFQSQPSSPFITSRPDSSNFIPQQLDVQITSHINGQMVPVGPLTIFGTSSDTSLRECLVYADLNDKMPFQNVLATGPGGPNDYSQWTFTYSSGYQLIQNGTNNLTSKIVCMDSPAAAKWYSINLTGISSRPLTITAGLPPPIGLPPSTPSQAGVTSPPLEPVFGVENEEEEDDLVNLFDSSNEEEEEEEMGTSDDEDEEEEDDDSGSRDRCPNGYHRSPSGDCERVRDLPDDLPRCPNGFHRSPDGDCEAVRD
jgi:hypothetical protein